MSGDNNYNVLTTENGVPIKAWTKGVQLEEQARKQRSNVANSSWTYWTRNRKLIFPRLLP
jgi:hypothetical protein